MFSVAFKFNFALLCECSMPTKAGLVERRCVLMVRLCVGVPPCTVVNQCPTTHPQTPPQRSLKLLDMAELEMLQELI